MAVAFVNATRANDGSSSTTDPLVITNASTTEGHTLVLLIDAETSGSTFAAGALTGWTLREGPDSSGNSNSWLFTRTVPAGFGSTTSIDFASAYRCVATMLAFSGADESLITGALSDVNSQTSATGTYTLPTLTGVPAGAMIVAGHARRRSGPAPSGPSLAGAYTWPANGQVATAFGSGANVFAWAGYALSASGGTVGGESSSSSLTSIGSNYLLAIPEAVTAVTRSAALSGSGTLAAAGSNPTTTFGATLGGSGSLAASGTPGYARSAALSSSGTLAATGKIGFTRAAALSGNGDLGALPVQGFVLAAGLDSVGELTADALGFAIGVLGSEGTLIGFPYLPGVVMDAVLSGGGSLSALIVPGLIKDAALTGSGALAAAGIIPPRAADLSGAGHLSTWGQNLIRLGTVVPITFRYGTALPVGIYLGDVLVWRP